MGSQVTSQLQSDIKSIIQSFNIMRFEAKDLYDLYWKGTVNTDVDVLSTSSTPASISGKYTKGNAQSGVTLVEQLYNFFNNIAVSQSDYMSSLVALTHGDAVLATAISSDVEDFAARVLQIARDCLVQYKRCKAAENFYNNTEIAGAIAGMSSATVIFGASMTKDQLTAAIVLCQQFQKMIQNEAVSTGDYKATLAKWENI